jgi:uncharacterized damage-inducible protein DinB
MSLSQALLPEFDQEMTNTRKILALVPEDKFDYKPHEKSMTLGRLAGHVAEMPSWASHTIDVDVLELKADQKPFSPATKQELLDSFDKFVVEGRKSIEGASDEELAKTWTLNYAGKNIFSLPKIAVLRGMVMNHMIHHRAQLGVYLRMNNIEFPGMYGPSADEMKSWSAPQS